MNRVIAITMGKRIIYLDHGLKSDDDDLCNIEEINIDGITNKKKKHTKLNGEGDNNEKIKGIFIHN